MRGLKLIEGLEPEQKEIINQVTMPGATNELSLVQGVAGSGKTTMALHIARKLGIDNQTLPSNRQATILFLTYNPRLAEYCANTLQDIPDLNEQINFGGEVASGKVNVFGIQDFFKQSLVPEQANMCLDDETCVGYLSQAASSRGVRTLLPWQIYSLIVTFLRGRPELIGLSIDVLEKKIQSEMMRSRDYRIYGESLQDIRGRLLKTYEDWKNGRMDRADVAANFRQQSLYIEELLNRMMQVDAVELRTQAQFVLGDRDLRLTEMTDWLKAIFANYESIPKISALAEKYAQVFEARKLSEDLWQTLRKDLLSWIPIYGIASEPLWGSLLRKLSNPVIIIDEVQDLSSVELENLVSLWFLLPKSPDSRLVMFGDINQQMTPSGFNWPTIINLVDEKQSIYERRMRKVSRPIELKNNYRTTEQIANTVYSMTSQVARYFPSDIADRFLEYCINPETTVPYSLKEKILDIQNSGEEDALVPRLFVGSPELFENALLRYAAELKTPETDIDAEKQLLSTVVITQHSDRLENLLEQDENRYALETNLLEIIPVMGCKGMEFDRCVLYGISVKSNSELEPDIVSNWYTSFTRARLLLFIYLSEEEFEYIRWAGWQDMPNDIVFLRHPNSIDQVVNAIRSIGNTDVDAETMYGMAEISYSRWLRSSLNGVRNEKYLETSLHRYKEAGRLDTYRNRSGNAATYYREQSNLRKAADYFALAVDPVQQVDCLECLRREMEKKAQPERIKELYEEIQDVVDGLGEEQLFEKARCYLVLGELKLALKFANEGDETLKNEIADKIYSRIQDWISDKKQADASWAADLLYEFEYWAIASKAYQALDRWEEAFNAAEKIGEFEQIGQDALLRAEAISTRNRSLAKKIAEVLSRYKLYLLAGKAYLFLRDYFAAVEAFVLAGELSLAKQYLDFVKEENKLSAYELLANGYFRKGTESWPSAYQYYYLADNQDRLQYIENLCRYEKKYVILARCFENTQLDKVRFLANQLELSEDRGNAELAAQCWEISKDWEQAAKNWMQVFFRESDQFEKLLGPNPKDGRLDSASKSRFYSHMTEHRAEYGIELEEWVQLDYYAVSDRDHFRKISEIVARMSKPDRWRNHLEARISSLYEVFERSNMPLPAGEGKIKPPGKSGLQVEQVVVYWGTLNDALHKFWDKAASVAWQAFDQDPLLGIQIMTGICRRPKEAELQMLDKLASRRNSDDRQAYIKSWEYFDWSPERIGQELGKMYPVQDAEFIWEAINLYFNNKSPYFTQETERFKKRLAGIKTAEARRLLRKYFPGEEPDKTIEKKAHSIKPGQSPMQELDELLDELVAKSNVWKLDVEDREELIEQINELRMHQGQNLRLASKLKLLRGLIPDDVLAEEKEFFNRLEQAGFKASAPQEGQDVSTLIASTNIPSESGSGVNIAPKPPKKEITSKPTVIVSSESETRKRRRTRKKDDAPGRLYRLNVHGDNQQDSDTELENAIQQVINDKHFRALLVVHGYGKDKEPSVLKDNVRTRIKRFRGHGRTREVLYGENLTRYGKEWELARRLCPDLENSDEICDNPGITLVLLKGH